MDFCLRPFERDDARSIARHANNKNVADNLRDAFPHPYTLDDALAYIDDCLKKDGGKQLVRAIVVDGEAVGCVGVFVGSDVYRRSAELGYWLGEDYWGRGIMTKAVSQICETAFERFDIVRVFAEPYACNAGSRRVLKKSGFELEGVMRMSVTKNGNTFDSVLYALV